MNHLNAKYVTKKLKLKNTYTNVKKKESKVPDYENILTGDTKAKIDVARYMKRHLRIYSNIVNRR